MQRFRLTSVSVHRVLSRGPASDIDLVFQPADYVQVSFRPGGIEASGDSFGEACEQVVSFRSRFRPPRASAPGAVLPSVFCTHEAEPDLSYRRKPTPLFR